MVTSLNEDNESVTVEWIENGDTKGKEVKHHYVNNLEIKFLNILFYLLATFLYCLFIEAFETLYSLI